MSYLLQKDGFRCVPVAIANLMIWSGDSTTFANQKIDYSLVRGALSELCHCTRAGTDYSRIVYGIRQVVDVAYEYRADFSISYVIKHLKNYGCVVMIYADGDATHISLVEKMNKNGSFRVINDIRGRITNVSKKCFVRIIKESSKKRLLGGFFVCRM